MIHVSEKASAALQGDYRKFRARFLLNGEVISGNIKNITVNKGSCGDSEFAPGALFSSFIDATIDYCPVALEKKELLLQFGVLVGTEYEWTDIGWYTVSGPATNVYTTSFTGLGRLSSRTGGIYETNLSFPAKTQDVLDEISEQIGVPIDASEFDTSGKIERKPSGYSYREMLAFIAGIFFGYVTEIPDGSIRFLKFSTENIVETNGDRTTQLPAFADIETEITGVRVTATQAQEDGNTNEKTFVYGIVNVALNNPFMTQALFDANVGNIIGFKYRTGTVPISMGDYRLEASDCLRVKDIAGNTYLVPCMNVQHVFDGGISTYVTAPTFTAEDDGSSFTGPIIMRIARYETDLVMTKKLVAGKVSADEVEALIAKIGYLTVNEANMKYAAIDELKSVSGKIDNLTATAITTNNLSAKVADLGYLTVEFADARYAYSEWVEANFAYLESFEAYAADVDNLKAYAITSRTIDAVVAELGYLKAETALLEYASIRELSAIQASFGELKANAVTINELDALVADLGYVTSKSIESNYATIANLNATTAKVDALTAKAITVDTLEAEVAELGYAKAAALEAVDGKIDNLASIAITTDNLAAKVGTFGYLKADELAAKVGAFGYLKASDLEAEVAEFGYLKAETATATYATITNLNAANASITNLSGDLAAYKKTVTDEFTARDAEIESLVAKEAAIEKVVADKAAIKDLEAVEGRVETLETTTLKTSALSAEVAKLGYATAKELEAAEARIKTLETDTIKAKDLESEVATFGYMKVSEAEATYATITNLNATNATINTLSSKAITTDNLSAKVAALGYLKASELEAEVAEFGYLKTTTANATFATITNLNAVNVAIADLSSIAITTDNLSAKVATLGYLKASELAAEVAEFGYLKASSLSAEVAELGYATIDLANVKAGSITSAMIGNGVVGTAQIADSSITDAKIVGLTANKITAGTLDAGTIEVVNLNAANITVGTINGKQIASGAIDTSKLTSSLNTTITNASTNASQALGDAAAAQSTADSAKAAADAAQTAANNAASAASAAQTTADGKNTVFYSTSAPAASGRKTNDIWFDTDDGNKMYYWNGSAWTVRQFGTSAIANASITNALIADATIQSAKIASLDAAKITTGTLSADRIGASSITTAKLASGAVTTDKLAANAVTADILAAGAVTANKIVSSAVTTDKLAANAVTTNKILAGAITADKISVSSLEAICAKIGGFTIGSTYLANNTTSLAGASNSVYVGTDGISCGTAFKVTKAGKLEATNVDVSGSIEADHLYVNARHGFSDYTGIHEFGMYTAREGASYLDPYGVTISSKTFASNTASTADDYVILGLWDALGFELFTTGGMYVEVQSDIQFVNKNDNYTPKMQIRGMSVYGLFNGSLTGNADSATTLTGLTATIAELNWCDGVTSNIQTQLNGKAASSHTHSGYAATSHSHSNYLSKTTYEYNTELALGSTGKVCIGKFPMYDSNISVEIKSTTSTTYNGTLVIATQNINTTGGGSYTVKVYGDADNSLTNSIKIHYGSGSNVFSVYIDLPGWSKNLLHIQCVSLAGTPTDIATTVSEIPSNATIVPTNALKAQLDGKAAASHTHSGYAVTGHTHSEYAAAGHTHSYLPLSGGTLTGELLFNTGTTQSATKGIKWSAINSKNPYIGYATDQTDGTFVVCSLLGTTYATGLAIGGGSGNLLYKGQVVLNASNYTSYAAAASHNHAASAITSGTLAVARGGTGVTSNPSMLINLASTTAAGVFATSPRPGVTGTLAIGNGGTGATTAAAARTALGITLANLGLTATAAELNYCDGVTSNIQTQLNSLKSSLTELGNAHNALASGVESDYLARAGGIMTGNITFQNTGEQNLTFKNAGSAAWTVQLYKGGSTYSNVIGLYDATNGHAVWRYSTAQNFGVDVPLWVGGNITSTGSVGVSGDLVSGNKSNYADGHTGVCVVASGNIHAQHASAPSLRFYVGSVTADNGRIYMSSEDYMYFSRASRYTFDKQIFSTTSTIGTSDRNKKKDFKEFDERYEKLFFALLPQLFKFKDGTSDRFHSGFVSQDIEEAMQLVGLDSKEFAGFCKEQQRRIVIDTDEEHVEELVFDADGNPVYDYMIREGEFISLNTYMLQKAYVQIENAMTVIRKQQKQIEALVAKLAFLETKYGIA